MYTMRICPHPIYTSRYYTVAQYTQLVVYSMLASLIYCSTIAILPVYTVSCVPSITQGG